MAVALAAVFGGGLVPQARALPKYLEMWKVRYGKSGSDATCLVCHTMPKGLVLNPYGRALFEAGLMNDMFKKTERLDSDKDGYSNLDEIRAGSLPGDPKMRPVLSPVLPFPKARETASNEVHGPLRVPPKMKRTVSQKGNQ